MIVKAELDKLRVHHLKVELGEVEVKEITDKQKGILKAALARSGLELMNDKRAILIEKIKNVIIELVHYSEELPKQTFPTI